MNLSQLITSFRTDADDAARPYLWSDDEVIGWLNEAEEEAAIRSKLIFESVRPEICQIDVSIAAGNVYKLHDAVSEIIYASLTDVSGNVTQLGIKDRFELSRLKPDWRTTTEKPQYLVHHDKNIELGCIVDASYTIKLEVHRLPLKCLAKESDTPEINRVHHKMLVQWALHRAYEKPDAETLNPAKSQTAEAKFTEYFGERPNADMRKAENANRPHVNKAYW